MSIIDNFKSSVAKAKETWISRLQTIQTQNQAAKASQADTEARSPLWLDAKDRGLKLPSGVETKYGFFPNTELRSPTTSERIQMKSGVDRNAQTAALKKPAFTYETAPFPKEFVSEIKEIKKKFGNEIDTFISSPTVGNTLNMVYGGATAAVSGGFSPISAGFKSLEAIPGGKTVNSVINYVPEKVIAPFVNYALKPLPGESKYITDLKQNFLAPMFNNILTLAFFAEAGKAASGTVSTIKEVTRVSEGSRVRWEQKEYMKAWKEATGKEMPRQVSEVIDVAVKKFPSASDIVQRKFTEMTDKLKNGDTKWAEKPDKYAIETPSVKDFDKYSSLSDIEFKSRDDMKLLRTRGVEGKVIGVENRAGQRQIFEDTKISSMEEHSWPAGVKQKFDIALYKKDAKTVQELLPQVPSEYKTRFRREISALPAEKQSIVPDKPQEIRGATEVAAPEISATEVKPVRTITELGRNIEAKAIEEGLTKGFSDLSGYDSTTLKIQAEKVSELIKTDYELAKRIAKGEEPAPSGMVSTAVFKAIEEIAYREKDVATIQELASSKLSTDVSGAGQLLSMLQDRDRGSAVSAMRELSNARKRVSEKRTKVSADKQTAKMKKATDAEIKGHIKKVTPKVNVWVEFMESIKCV